MKLPSPVSKLLHRISFAFVCLRAPTAIRSFYRYRFRYASTNHIHSVFPFLRPPCRMPRSFTPQSGLQQQLHGVQPQRRRDNE